MPSDSASISILIRSALEPARCKALSKSMILRPNPLVLCIGGGVLAGGGSFVCAQAAIDRQDSPTANDKNDMFFMKGILVLS